MAYSGSNEIGSLRFLAANVIYQATQRILEAEDGGDSDILSDAVLLMDVVSSYYTEKDQAFAKEWAAIQKDRLDRAKAPFAPGEDRAQDDGFRWRELKAMFRALCRSGAFVRIDSPSAEWNPKVATQ